jgi:sulfoxide reductase heme-binding subunit YedZ
VVLGGCFLWLMLWRALPGWGRAHPGALAGMAAVAALGTAAMEFAWYAAATNLPAGRILAANLDLGAGIRPAQGVAAAGLALATLPLLRRLARRPASA